jgi:DNA (cytosine-5)-methyltransferase 1
MSIGKGCATPDFNFVWSNQYEPGCKRQHAAQVYKARWGEVGFVNRDINAVLADSTAMADIAALKPNMLVAGFPCQDYSVVRPLNQSQGLEGKKGVLWWSIHAMLQACREAGQPLGYLMFENVDRLISSPSACCGRDFAVILSSLQGLGYAIEWRVVNSGDYGFPQRRRRVFIMAYHQSTAAYAQLEAAACSANAATWLTEAGTFAKALPAVLKAGQGIANFGLSADVVNAQDDYEPNKGDSCFLSAGICVGGTVWTAAMLAAPLTDFTRYVGQRDSITLGDVVAATRNVPSEYFLDDAQLPRWEYLKGAKSVERVSATGFGYTFAEGALAFPDPLDKPSRTVITSEGGRCASRTSHVVTGENGRLRRLVPEELEALNGFPRGFTDVPGIPAAKRAFMMGNALVTGVVRAIGEALMMRHVASEKPLTDGGSLERVDACVVRTRRVESAFAEVFNG